jgi:hypothetical protein
VPFEHTRPVPQVEPQVPQLVGSLETSTQAPPHDVWPVGQEEVSGVVESLGAESVGTLASDVASRDPPSLPLVDVPLQPAHIQRDATAKT